MTAAEDNSGCSYFRQLCVCRPKNLCIWALLLFVFYFIAGQTSKNYSTTFDYLLFTQRWLPSACIQYIERPRPYSRHCILPSNFKMWAIHGLWPTQNAHMGPFFCNSSMEFDARAIESIKSDLLLYWPNIEGEHDSSSLWKHEWDKHGTCAAQLDLLNTEFKYFAFTLNLYKRYNIGNILKRSNVIPSLSRGYYVSDLFNILQSSLGKLPQIHCIFETHTNQPYLFEIRMCFDKDFDLIDCDKTHKFGQVSTLTNCPQNRPIIYPDSSTPPDDNDVSSKNSKEDFRLQLVELLKLVRFMQWVLL